MNHGLARLHELPLSLRLIGEIHAELLRGPPRRARDTRRVPPHQNWIGPKRCLPETGHVRPATGTRDEGGPLCARAVPLHRARATASDPRRPRPRPVREHPPIPRRQRTGRAPTDHLSARSWRRATGPAPVPELLPEATPRRVLRPPHGRPHQRRLEGWLRFFLRGVAETAREAADTAERISSCAKTIGLSFLPRQGQMASSCSRCYSSARS